MGKRKAEDGDIVRCHVRNYVTHPHIIIGKVLSYDQGNYLVDLWFFDGLPQSFSQRNPGYRVVYKVRPFEIGQLQDQSEQAIREQAHQSEQKAVAKLGPPIRADDPKSVTDWLTKGKAQKLPDYDPDEFLNMPELDWDRAIFVQREVISFPEELKTPKGGNWWRPIYRGEWAAHVA